MRSSLVLLLALSGCSSSGDDTRYSAPIGEAASSGAGGGGATSTSATSGSGGALTDDPDGALGFQIDASHSGASHTKLSLPLSQAWVVDLGAQVSYPVIVDRRVFVTADKELYALDLETGATVWGPTALGGSVGFAAVAFEGGRLFAVNGDGLMTAFAANDGAPQWSRQLPGQYSFSSAPTAFGGKVYVGGAGSGGTLYAVDESNGDVLWQAPVENGDNSSPVVTSHGVFVDYACNNAYGFDPASGAPLWKVSGPCEGGGGATMALANGLLFARDSATGNVLLDVATGTAKGAFNADLIPAFDAANGYFLTGATLEARPLDALQNLLWSFAGDGMLASSPLTVNGVVYVGSLSGMLYGLDPSSGTTLWSADAGSPIATGDDFGQVVSGLGAGDGFLIVPATNALVAYK